MVVTLRQEQSGGHKTIKVGFSWTILFFGGCFGIPLFVRKLNGWGVLFLIATLASLWLTFFADDFAHFAQDVIQATDDKAVLREWFFAFLFLGIGAALGISQIWLAFKGNELAAKNYLSNGWTFASADAPETRLAEQRWGLVATRLDRPRPSAHSASGAAATRVATSDALADIPLVRRAASDSSADGSRFCTQCGRATDPAGRFCASCGTPLWSPRQPESIS